MFMKTMLMAANIDSDAAKHVPNRSAHPYGVRKQLLGFAQHFRACLDVAQQRRRLRSLDEEALRDIGVSRADALREANRLFWDIPQHLRPYHATTNLTRDPDSIRRWKQPRSKRQTFS